MPQSKPRTYVGLLAALIGTALFLLVAPAVEQEAHLRSVRQGEPQEILEALRRLCWVRSGVEGLNETLAQLPVERRLLVLEQVSTLGCLDQLSPEHHVESMLGQPDGVDRAVGFADHAVEPATELLTAADESVASRAAQALVILLPRTNATQRSRIAGLLATAPNSGSFQDLRERLATVSGAETVVSPSLDVGLDDPGPDTESDPADLGTATEDASTLVPDAGEAGEPEEPLVPALKMPTLERPRGAVLYRAPVAQSDDAGGAPEPAAADMGASDD